MLLGANLTVLQSASFADLAMAVAGTTDQEICLSSVGLVDPAQEEDVALFTAESSEAVKDARLLAKRKKPAETLRSGGAKSTRRVRIARPTTEMRVPKALDLGVVSRVRRALTPEDTGFFPGDIDGREDVRSDPVSVFGSDFRTAFAYALYDSSAAIAHMETIVSDPDLQATTPEVLDALELLLNRWPKRETAQLFVAFAKARPENAIIDALVFQAKRNNPELAEPAFDALVALDTVRGNPVFSVEVNHALLGLAQDMNGLAGDISYSLRSILAELVELEALDVEDLAVGGSHLGTWVLWDLATTEETERDEALVMKASDLLVGLAKSGDAIARQAILEEMSGTLGDATLYAMLALVDEAALSSFIEALGWGEYLTQDEVIVIRGVIEPEQKSNPRAQRILQALDAAIAAQEDD